MTITITPGMLCCLTDNKFSFEACEAICEYFDECGDDTAPYIGDIIIGFYEADEDELGDFDEDEILTILSNGKALVVR